ncbi:bifunctional nitric oxide dioxygenase/dihydropteridine reductase 2 (plasmid) [Tsukamurella tyrosinosolvens]|nr:bifunctional nitric oxide dioxygenase/dihydropteridine reductase 2 [Tsukamurella tyrosinosolvens]
MTATATRGRAFHTLTVADVESLCDDAVAVTFDVPPALADEFAFAAGQSLTLRRTVDGVEHRRSYSICAPVGERPRVGVREVTDGLFSSWLVHRVRPGDTIEVQGPTGPSRPTPTRAACTCSSRPVPASPRCCPSPAPCSPIPLPA